VELELPLPYWNIFVDGVLEDIVGQHPGMFFVAPSFHFGSIPFLIFLPEDSHSESFYWKFWAIWIVISWTIGVGIENCTTLSFSFHHCFPTGTVHSHCCLTSGEVIQTVGESVAWTKCCMGNSGRTFKLNRLLTEKVTCCDKSTKHKNPTISPAVGSVL